MEGTEGFNAHFVRVQRLNVSEKQGAARRIAGSILQKQLDAIRQDRDWGPAPEGAWRGGGKGRWRLGDRRRRAGAGMLDGLPMCRVSKVSNGSSMLGAARVHVGTTVYGRWCRGRQLGLLAERCLLIRLRSGRAVGARAAAFLFTSCPHCSPVS